MNQSMKTLTNLHFIQQFFSILFVLNTLIKIYQAYGGTQYFFFINGCEKKNLGVNQTYVRKKRGTRANKFNTCRCQVDTDSLSLSGTTQVFDPFRTTQHAIVDFTSKLKTIIVEFYNNLLANNKNR